VQMRGVPAERKAELEARHGEARRQRKAEEAAKVAAGKDGGGGQTTGDNGTEAAEARRWKRVEQAAAEGAQAVERPGVMAGDRAGGGAAVPTRGRRRTDEGGAHGREGGRDTRASGRRHAASRIASVGSRGETVPAARRGGAS
jgi:hypothetical protein